jgi:hypothetical protein
MSFILSFELMALRKNNQYKKDIATAIYFCEWNRRYQPVNHFLKLHRHDRRIVNQLHGIRIRF